MPAACRRQSVPRLTLDEINPVHLLEPAAPLFRRAGRESLQSNSARSIAKSRPGPRAFPIWPWRAWAAGAFPSPPGYEVRDWARELGFPVVVVARGTLGTLNHTLLTVDSILKLGLACAGIVLNAGPEQASPPASPDFDLTRRRNAALLRDLLGLPVFEFDRGVEAAGHVPLWLGGKIGRGSD